MAAAEALTPTEPEAPTWRGRKLDPFLVEAIDKLTRMDALAFTIWWASNTLNETPEGRTARLTRLQLLRAAGLAEAVR